MIENQTGRSIVKLKTDRGGEYSSTEFLNYLQSEGIQIERGPAHRPMANAVAERFNRTLLGRIRSQLCQSGLPLSLWGELALYCSHQINCTPSRAIRNKAPIDLFHSLIPTHTHPFSYDRLKPFGCLAFAHDRHRVSKISPVAKRFIFVGIEPNANAWRLWDKSSQKIFITGDVAFREKVFPAAHETPPSSNINTFIYPTIYDAIPSPDTNIPQYNQSSTNTPNHTDTHLNSSDASCIEQVTETPALTTENATNESIEAIITETTEVEPSDSAPPRRSLRAPAPRTRYGFSATDNHDSDHPTYTQAMASADKGAWLTAMQEEFDAFKRHSVGTLVDVPPGANVLGGMWIFTKKRDQNNRICRFKA